MSYDPLKLEDLTAEQQEIVNKANQPKLGHLSDYVRDLHIIIGPNGMCRCGEDGLTCGERLSSVSENVRNALIQLTP